MRRAKKVLAKGRKLQASQRSLAYLRKYGWTAEVCEQFKARVEGKGQQRLFKGGFRKDLFGFMDILAYKGHATVAVQTTSRRQIATHLREYRRNPKVRQRILGWLQGGHRSFVIHGWECVVVPCIGKSKNPTKGEWQLTQRFVRAEDLPDPDEARPDEVKAVTEPTEE